MMQDSVKNNFIKRWWRVIDQQTIIAMIILVSFSLMLVTTASPAVANRIGLTDNYFSSRHIIFLFLAAIIVLVFSSLDKKWIRRFAILGFLASLIMLVFVKLYGFEVKGATRWINIAGFSYQPSEFMKPFFAVVTGWVLSIQYQEEFPSFKACFCLFVLVVILLIIQPDFGMIVMVSAVFGIQLFVAGLPIIWIFIAVFGAVSGSVGAYLLLPHVATRINKFLDPSFRSNFLN